MKRLLGLHNSALPSRKTVLPGQHYGVTAVYVCTHVKTVLMLKNLSGYYDKCLRRVGRECVLLYEGEKKSCQEQVPVCI